MEELVKNMKRKVKFARLTLEQEKMINNFVIEKMERKLKPFFISKKRRKTFEVDPVKNNANSSAPKQKKDSKISKHEQSDLFKNCALIQLMKQTHRRAKSHLQRNSSKNVLQKSKKCTPDELRFSKSVKVYKPTPYDFEKIQNIERNKFYPGLDDLKEQRAQTDRVYRNLSDKTNIAKELSDFIDEIDFQFKEGLLEKLYSTENLKIRKKMNEQRWRATVRKRKGSELAKATDKNGQPI